MIAYVSQAFQDSEVEMLQPTSLHFSKSIHRTFSETITICSVLASSISTGSSLPPGLAAQSSSNISQEMLMGCTDQDYLPISHREALVVIEVATSQIAENLVGMIEVVKAMVGEISLEV